MAKLSSLPPFATRAHAVRDGADGCEEGDCPFCGKTIRHVEDGGPGWLVGAMLPDGPGEPRNDAGELLPAIFLVCEDPKCAARDAAEQGETPTTPEQDRAVFRCGCDVGGFYDSIGPVCYACGKGGVDLVRWD